MSCWNGQCTPEKKGSTGTCWGGSKFGINLQDSATFQGFLSHLHSLLLFSVCSPPNFRMYFAPVHEISPAEDGVVAAHWCTFSHPQRSRCDCCRTGVIGWSIQLPSGKHTKNYGKSQFLMGKLTISMAMFNSYVKLPEGKVKRLKNM